MEAVLAIHSHSNLIVIQNWISLVGGIAVSACYKVKKPPSSNMNSKPKRAFRPKWHSTKARICVCAGIRTNVEHSIQGEDILPWCRPCSGLFWIGCDLMRCKAGEKSHCESVKLLSVQETPCLILDVDKMGLLDYLGLVSAAVCQGWFSKTCHPHVFRGTFSVFTALAYIVRFIQRTRWRRTVGKVIYSSPYLDNFSISEIERLRLRTCISGKERQIILLYLLGQKCTDKS
jgi:hypothetical protein